MQGKTPASVKDETGGSSAGEAEAGHDQTVQYSTA